MPVYQTATFTLGDVGITKGFDYSRSANPTRASLETQLAALEAARYGCAFASGMAAIAAITALLRPGDHVVASQDVYGGTHRFLTQFLARYNIETTFADLCDRAQIHAALKPNTRLFWIESPTNPLLKIIDIAYIASLKTDGQIVAVDNTLASPFFQQPLLLGADLVVHSTTKYICGHSDVVGGIVLTNDAEIYEQIAFYQNAVGAVPGPWDAYLTLRGAKTLALRMQQHECNAAAVAEFLAFFENVSAVYYPGLSSDPGHELAKKQMSGFGGVISFRVRGGAEQARALARSTRVFNLATSLGGVESLICLPAFMTHGSLSNDERARLGITDDLLRISVGIEDIDDLIDDLSQAMQKANEP